ncbi:MAG TPA: carboxypeptidase regulatory-like domain-containing protein [Longimicrobiaceae bacterium]|nr:carboxypeptidase regulatory-like domain-containing protein [Longimicrobiaceae bacterium]
MKRLLTLLLAVALAAAAHLPLAAQSTTDIITGTITGPTGGVIPGAQVTVTSLETGISRNVITNAQGRYTLAFPEGSGQYRVEVTAVGMTPVSTQLVRQADESVLVGNIRLGVAPVMLESLEVVGQRRRANPDGREPGTQERVLSGQALQRLPVDPTDIDQIAALTPGVISVSGDSVSGFSVLGQGPAGNQMTLDGVSFGGGEGFGGGNGTGVPSEAIRVTRVITNTYDVSRGQFSGGQIATTTRGGTNRAQGSFTYALRDPSLEWTGSNSAFGGSYRLNRLSGGVGGPIVKNRAFYFGAISYQRRSEGVPSLLSADPLRLQQLGVSPDSVARLLALAQANDLYDPNAAVPDDRIGNSTTALARLDFNLSSSQTLTLRGDGQWFSQDALRVGALSLPQNGGTLTSRSGGLMLSLTSRFGNGWVNELRGYGSHSTRNMDPTQAIPAARVRVSSELEDGATGISTLGLGGGSTSLDSHGTNWEATDELSLLIGTSHQIKLGVDVLSTSTTQETGANRYGTFGFNSLADFEAGRPSSFSRMLVLRQRESGGMNGSVYLGDTWRASDHLQLNYGTRLESSRVGTRPEYNPAVEQVFGLRTDRIPTEVALTPRAGFSYTIGGGGGDEPIGVLRGGLGAFRATPPWSLFAAARDLTGLPGAQEQISCVGTAVPAPEWAAYLSDPASIPSGCEGESTGGPVSGRGTSVAVFDPDYRASQSWRASLGFQRRIDRFLAASVDATYAEGVYQQGVVDLNRVRDARFTLPQEDGRPIYVPADAIVPGTGETSFLASRLHPEFGQVVEVNSDRRSRTAQVTLGLNGFVPQWRTFFSLNYTLMRSRDQGSGGGWGFGRGGFGGIGLGSLPVTSGDPDQPEWGTSDFERRHSFTATLGRSIASWLDATLIGRATSGNPFTPLVGSDINGDGARNDAAFIFDPASATDPAVAAAMTRLLSTVPGGVKDCLEEQLGQLAGRNSCRSPWSYSLDMQFNVHPQLPSLGRRLTISVQAVNALTGLDQALHGSSNLHGWGQSSRPDPILLYPRGFDPASESYVYEVNERFGSNRSSTAVIRNPFQIQIQASIAVGSQRGGFGGFGGFGGGRRGRGRFGGGEGGGGGQGGGMEALVARAFPNPIARIVELADSLHLSAAQTDSLKALSATLQLQQDSLSADVQAAGNGGGRGGGSFFQTIFPKMEQSRKNVQAALKQAQQILTPEQWKALPADAKTPPRQFGGGRF